jgi:hypothetical protein
MANFNSPVPTAKEQDDNESKIADQKSDYVADLLDSSRLKGNIDEIINPKPEATPSVEQEFIPEKVPEQATPQKEAETFKPQATPVQPVQPQPIVQPAVKNPEVEEIENILSEGLEDVYKNLDPQAKQNFRRKGEETANLIQQTAHSIKFTFKWLVGIITSWLLTIPKVNRFFLEQETKIKADRLINWKEN